ncbi:unnamed protein product [Schistosoma turkestanicum]|nr:unnamed protein product [Schistosoma turkestanicum]
MLHRPTLMPPSMKSSTKFNLSTNSPHPSQSIKIESPELIQLFNCNDDDEIVVVEPTDPDEDRMKQEETTFEDVLNKKQEDHNEEVDHNGNETDMNSTESNMPVSTSKVVDEPTVSETQNEAPITVTTDSVRPISILPLNDAIQTLLTCTPHVPTIQNVSIQPILPGKVSGSGSVQNPSVVPSVLPTLWLHSPVVNPTAISVPNLNNLTDLTNNIVQNTTNALNPLVAAVLVNCATVNMISQLAGSMCSPIMNSLIDANVSVSNVNSNNNNLIQSGITSSCNSGSGVTTVTIPTASILPNLLSAIPLSTHVPGLTMNTTNAVLYTSANNVCDVGVNSAVVSSTGTLITNNSNNTGSMIVIPSKVENVPTTSLSSSVNFSQAERKSVTYNTGELNMNNSQNNNNNNNNNNSCTMTKNAYSKVVFNTKCTKESRKHTCTYPGCGKSYTRRHRLNQHISTHTGTGPIPCDAPNCNVRYFSEEDLKRHKLSQHTLVEKGPRRRHVCTYSGCGKSYSELNKLREHLRTHTGERPYVCRKPGCGATFVRLSGVKSHELTHVYIHKRSKRLTQYPISMINHIIGTSFDSSELKLTNQDNAEMSSVSLDTLPKSTEISPIMPKNCTFPMIAPKSTDPPSSSLLPISTVSWDSGLKLPHVCPFKECGKVFLKRNKLRDHIYRHTGIRPFVCDQCKASFVQRYELRCHSYVHLRAAQSKIII